MNSLAHFTFLKDRYKSDFYLTIINKYFVLLAYFSHRSGIKLDGIIKDVIELFFSGKIIELDKYDATKIYCLLTDRDCAGIVSLEEFLLLGSDEHVIILVIYLYLKHKQLFNQKKDDLFAFISLLYHTQFLYRKNEQALKYWRVSGVSYLLIPYPIEKLQEWFNASIQELHGWIHQGERGGLFMLDVLELLRDFERFVIKFLARNKSLVSAKVKSYIVSAYSIFRQELVHFAHIKKLILAGII